MNQPRVLIVDDDAALLQALPEALRLRSEEHTSELQSPCNLVCRLLLEKKKQFTHVLQRLLDSLLDLLIRYLDRGSALGLPHPQLLILYLRHGLTLARVRA